MQPRIIYAKRCLPPAVDASKSASKAEPISHVFLGKKILLHPAIALDKFVTITTKEKCRVVGEGLLSSLQRNVIGSYGMKGRYYIFQVKEISGESYYIAGNHITALLSHIKKDSEKFTSPFKKIDGYFSERLQSNIWFFQVFSFQSDIQLINFIKTEYPLAPKNSILFAPSFHYVAAEIAKLSMLGEARAQELLQHYLELYRTDKPLLSLQTFHLLIYHCLKYELIFDSITLLLDWFVAYPDCEKLPSMTLDCIGALVKVEKPEHISILKNMILSSFERIKKSKKEIKNIESMLQLCSQICFLEGVAAPGNTRFLIEVLTYLKSKTQNSLYDEQLEFVHSSGLESEGAVKTIDPILTLPMPEEAVLNLDADFGLYEVAEDKTIYDLTTLEDPYSFPEDLT